LAVAYQYITDAELGTIAYTQQGMGANTLVLLHGFCEDSGIWANILPNLTDDYTVICIDIGSFGASALLGAGSIDRMAAQVAAVLTELACAPCVIIGHSLGGYVALSCLAQFPNRLCGIGLLHSHPYADSPEKQINRSKSIEFVQRNGTAPFVKQLFYALFAPDFARQHTVFIEQISATAKNIAPEAIIAASAAMRDRPDRSDILAQTNLPVLFICGQQDHTIPVEQSLAQSLLPTTAKLVLLEGVGHMGMYEAPAEVAAAMRKYLAFVFG
jgi:pimeloyl-ACP methyl ester carboxylesterase